MSGEGLLPNNRATLDGRAIGAVTRFVSPVRQQGKSHHAAATLCALVAFEVCSLRVLTDMQELATQPLARLGLDQLDCLTVAMELEERLSIAIPDDTVTRDRTCRQIADALLPLLPTLTAGDVP
jgi:acyl carrier protein